MTLHRQLMNCRSGRRPADRRTRPPAPEDAASPRGAPSPPGSRRHGMAPDLAAIPPSGRAAADLPGLA